MGLTGLLTAECEGKYEGTGKKVLLPILLCKHIYCLTLKFTAAYMRTWILPMLGLVYKAGESTIYPLVH